MAKSDLAQRTSNVKRERTMSELKSEIKNLKSASACAPGKIILFGEHAVVYGRPAIAVPVCQVRADATIEPRADGRVEIDAVDLARRYWLEQAREGDPLAAITRLTCARLGVTPGGFTARIHSTIPLGGGLGSGAAVSVALARALGKYFATGNTETTEKTKKISVALTNEEISALAYEVEKLHHGTPSGIDNTVIAFEKPVYFVKGNPIEAFRIAQPFTLAIADTGIAAPTKLVVGDVRRAWELNRALYAALFDQIGALALTARQAMASGEVNRLGALMRRNQILLRQLGVSAPALERLALAATTAGARGAKLSGAGRGGNVIALVDSVTQDKVVSALLKAGAKRVIVTEVK